MGEVSDETGHGVALGLGTIDDSEADGEVMRFVLERIRLRGRTGGGVDGVGDAPSEPGHGAVDGDREGSF